MKDLIVTTISANYEWSEIRNWICSLKDSGFTGDILVLAYNFVDTSYLQKLQEMGAIVVTPTIDYRGNEETNWIWHSGQVNKDNAHKLIHNVRLFHLWLYLDAVDPYEYAYIIFTDSRDVIFQTDPSNILRSYNNYEMFDIVVPSEGVTYLNQQWNASNMLYNYGGLVLSHMNESTVANVGTFACHCWIARDLLLTMYLMSKDTGHADQPSFNILINGLLSDRVLVVDHNDPWAFQIGARVDRWKEDCIVTDDGILHPSLTSAPYAIVHQYDRIPELKQMIDKRYEGR